jgi:hypothetical protein
LKLSPIYRIIQLSQNTATWWTLLSVFVGIGVSLLLVPYYGGLVVVIPIIVFLLAVRAGRKDTIENYRKNKCRYPLKIGILRGYVPDNNWNLCPLGEGVKSSEDWQRIFRSKNHDYFYYDACLIFPHQIDNSFVIIINPYGERYLEEDLARRRTFHRIKEYLKRGGIFVNTAGLAFYYMLDIRTGLIFITGEQLESVVPISRLYQDGRIRPEDLKVFNKPNATDFLHSWQRENFNLKTTSGGEIELSVFWIVRLITTSIKNIW